MPHCFPLSRYGANSTLTTTTENQKKVCLACLRQALGNDGGAEGREPACIARERTVHTQQQTKLYGAKNTIGAERTKKEKQTG